MASRQPADSLGESSQKPTEGPFIVEGWKGDEDEDVDIDTSDEKEGDSEDFCGDGEVESAATRGSSSQFFKSVLRERRSQLHGVCRDDLQANSLKGDAVSCKIPKLSISLEESRVDVQEWGEDSGARLAGIGNGVPIVRRPRSVKSFRMDRFGSGPGSSSKMNGKRLDARRFRREFSAKISVSKIPGMQKHPSRMRGSIGSDNTDRNSSSQDEDVEAGQSTRCSPTATTRSPVKQGSRRSTGDMYKKLQSDSQDELSIQLDQAVGRNTGDKKEMMDHSKKEAGKKRRYEELAKAQLAADRKLSLRDRSELRSREDVSRRDSGGLYNSPRRSRALQDVDKGSPPKSISSPPHKFKRLKKDTEPVSVSSEKQIPEVRSPKRPNKSVEEGNGLAVTESAGIKSKEKLHQSIEKLGRPDGKEKVLNKQPVNVSVESVKDQDLSTKLWGTERLEKLFERKASKNNEKPTGETLPLTQAVGCYEEPDVAVAKEPQGKEKVERVFERRPSKSKNIAHKDKGAQPHIVKDSQEFQKSVVRQSYDMVDGGKVFRRRRNMSPEKDSAHQGACGISLEGKVKGYGDKEANAETKKNVVSGADNKHELIPSERVGQIKEKTEVADCEKFLSRKLTTEVNLNGKRKKIRSRTETDNNSRTLESMETGAELDIEEGDEEEELNSEGQLKQKARKVSACTGNMVPSLVVSSMESSSPRCVNSVWNPQSSIPQSKRSVLCQGTRAHTMIPSFMDPAERARNDTDSHRDSEVLWRCKEIQSSSDKELQPLKVLQSSKDIPPHPLPDSSLPGVQDGNLTSDGTGKLLVAMVVEKSLHGKSRVQTDVSEQVSCDLGTQKNFDEGCEDLTSQQTDVSNQKEVVTMPGFSPSDPQSRRSVKAGSEGPGPLPVDTSNKCDEVEGFCRSARTIEAAHAITEHVKSPSNCNDSVNAQKENQMSKSDQVLCSEEDETVKTSIDIISIDDKNAGKQVTRRPAVEEKSDSEDGPSNDDHNSFCENCKLGGELLCCDGSGCKVTYHLDCLDPVLSEIPSGNWYCPGCAQKRLSYGVHAVSKAVETIWDVRDCGLTSQRSYSCHIPHKDPPTELRDIPSSLDEQRTSDLSKGCPVVVPQVEEPVIIEIDDEDDALEVDKCTHGQSPSRSQRRTRKRPAETQEQNQVDRSRSDGSGNNNVSKGKEGKVASGSSLTMVETVPVLEKGCGWEYFVKWKGISHIHNTWIAESELLKLAPKGLARFKRRLELGQVPKWNPEWVEPQRFLKKRLNEPSRRLGGGRGRGHLGMNAGLEWFVKWKGLGYEHCTWEPVQTGIIDGNKVEELELTYDKWCEAARQRTLSGRIEEVKRLRDASFVKLDNQPDWIQGGELLPNQLYKLNLLRERWHHNKNTILVDEGEQERTTTAVAFLLSMIEEYGAFRPILILVPPVGIQTWEAELLRLAEHVNTVLYSGVKEARAVVQRYELNKSDGPLKVQIVLTTFEVASTDHEFLSKFDWEAMIVDEGHRWKMMKPYPPLEYTPTFRLIVVNDLSKFNVEELQQILHFVDSQNSSQGSDIQEHLKELDENGQLTYLREKLTTNTVTDCNLEESSRLELKEHWVAGHMTPIQVHLYCNTLTKHFNVLHSGRMRSDQDSFSVQDVVSEVRQCCNHPYLVDTSLQESIKQELGPSESLLDAGIELSGKFKILHLILSQLHAAGRRVIVLCQMAVQLYYLDDYMRQKFSSDTYELVDSRFSSMKKNASAQKFNAKDSSRFCFIVRTGASGISLKVKETDAVIIYDSDLNPSNDTQYLRKLLCKMHGELQVYRLYTPLTVEEASVVYFREKRLEPDNFLKSISAKYCQQLLRWKVKELLEVDGTYSAKTASLKREQKNESSKMKVDHADELVKKILKGTNGEDAETKFPTEDVMPEEEGEYLKDFWSVLLRDRYADWQAREKLINTGKGLRARKKVQYSEDILALASYVVVDEESKKRRKKSTVVEPGHFLGLREKTRNSSLQSSPSTPGRVENSQGDRVSQGNIVSPRASNESKVLETPKEKSIPSHGGVAGDIQGEHLTTEVAVTADNQKKNPHEPIVRATTNRTQAEIRTKPASSGSMSGSKAEEGRRLRNQQQQLLLSMRPMLSQICEDLEVPASVASHAQELLIYVMNHFRMPREPRELVVMVAISLCLVAGLRLKYDMQNFACLSKVAEKMKLELKKDDFPPVYERVEGLCKVCPPPPLPTEIRAGQEKVSQVDVVDIGTVAQLTGLLPEQSPPRHLTEEALEQPEILDDKSEPETGFVTQSIQNGVLPDSPEGPPHKPDNLLSSESTQSHVEQREGVDVEPEPTPIISTEPGRSEDHVMPLEAQSPQNKQVRAVNDPQEQAVAVDSAIQGEIQETISQRDQEQIRTRLKLDKDKIFQTLMSKQKVEVSDFHEMRQKEREAVLKRHQDKLTSILTMNLSSGRKEELLRLQGDTQTADMKLFDRGMNEQHQVLISRQREARDKLNSLYSKLLLQVVNGATPDLLTEARTVLPNMVPNSVGTTSPEILGQESIQAGQASSSSQVQQTPEMPAVSREVVIEKEPPQSQPLPQTQCQMQTQPSSQSVHPTQHRGLPQQVTHVQQNLNYSQAQGHIPLGQVPVQTPQIQRPLFPRSQVQSHQQESSQPPLYSQSEIPASSHVGAVGESNPSLNFHHGGRLQGITDQRMVQPSAPQSRGSQIRRPHQSTAARSTTCPTPSCGQVLPNHSRLQPQHQQQISTQGMYLVNPALSAGVTPVLTQVRPNMVLHNSSTLGHFGMSLSQNQLGPDPLAHEEHRLRKEQDKVKLTFEEETAAVKVMYEKEAEELRKKFEAILQDKHRTMEQKTSTLQRNLEKVERNRRLAEALKLRSSLDAPPARALANQGPAEAATGSGQVGHPTSGAAVQHGRMLLQAHHQGSIAAGRNGVAQNLEALSRGGDVGSSSGGAALSSGRVHLHPSHQSNILPGRSISVPNTDASLSIGHVGIPSTGRAFQSLPSGRVHPPSSLQSIAGPGRNVTSNTVSALYQGTVAGSLNFTSNVTGRGFPIFTAIPNPYNSANCVDPSSSAVLGLWQSCTPGSLASPVGLQNITPTATPPCSTFGSTVQPMTLSGRLCGEPATNLTGGTNEAPCTSQSGSVRHCMFDNVSRYQHQETASMHLESLQHRRSWGCGETGNTIRVSSCTTSMEDPFSSSPTSEQRPNLSGQASGRTTSPIENLPLVTEAVLVSVSPHASPPRERGMTAEELRHGGLPQIRNMNLMTGSCTTGDWNSGALQSSASLGVSTAAAVNVSRSSREHDLQRAFAAVDGPIGTPTPPSNVDPDIICLSDDD